MIGQSSNLGSWKEDIVRERCIEREIERKIERKRERKRERDERRGSKREIDIFLVRLIRMYYPVEAVNNKAK